MRQILLAIIILVYIAEVYLSQRLDSMPKQDGDPLWRNKNIIVS